MDAPCGRRPAKERGSGDAGPAPPAGGLGVGGQGLRCPGALVRRRVLTAAKRLRKAGVTRLVVPEAFAYGEQLEKVGVAPVSTLPLRRALADLARAVMAGRNLSGGSARLAVAGDQLSGELVRTVTELALGNRYVLLDVPYGGDTLANQLRREYGVSLLLSPTRQQMDEADVLVLFAARTDLRRRDPAVLRLYDEAAPLPPLLLPPVLEGQMPPGLCRPQLLAVLVESGVLRPGQITVGTAES